MEKEIAKYLRTEYIGKKIYYYDSLPSTNIEAKNLASLEDEGTVIIAEEQTRGRGRLGRSWESPKGKGIWLSIILKPRINPTYIAPLTLIGAAAVSLGLHDIGIESGIKWPNDIVINGKKVCGILTEMSTGKNCINHVIMGIGINVGLKPKDFSKKALNQATSLEIETGKKIKRERLVAKLLYKFEKLYTPFIKNKNISKAIKICRENSAVIGKEVRMISGKKEKYVKVLDIDACGRLVVKYRDGKIDKLTSGEISIRGVNRYV